MQIALARLDAFNAITTLSIVGNQTDPFTLETIKPKYHVDCEQIAEYIEARSRALLVEPYRDVAALTAREIVNLLDHPDEMKEKIDVKPKKKVVERSDPNWLKEWDAKRARLKAAG